MSAQTDSGKTHSWLPWRRRQLRVDRLPIEPKTWREILQHPRELAPWLTTLIGVPAFGLMIVTVYGLAVDGATVIAVGFLVAGGAFMFGALLGFLFGVPRALSDPAGQRSAMSNTNLEQISDWLTKIIVGVGLVEIGQLLDSCARVVRFLAPALGDPPANEPFTAASLAFFTAAGFMIAYVVTRGVLPMIFWESEHGGEGQHDSEAAGDRQPSTPHPTIAGATTTPPHA